MQCLEKPSTITTSSYLGPATRLIAFMLVNKWCRRASTLYGGILINRAPINSRKDICNADDESTKLCIACDAKDLAFSHNTSGPCARCLGPVDKEVQRMRNSYDKVQVYSNFCPETLEQSWELLLKHDKVKRGI